MSTPAKAAAQRARRNVVAVAMREGRGWSQVRLAEEFERAAGRLGIRGLPRKRSTIVTEISRVERGVITVPDDMYLRLWCEVFELNASELFGRLDSPARADDIYVVTSHKFIPVYLGCDGAKTVHALGEPAAGQWVASQRTRLDHPDGRAEAYVWPFGVVVVHLQEQVEFASISELAIWRRNSYPAARRWVNDQLQDIAGTSVKSPYVLSAYWLDRARWHGETLDTAVRLLAMPAWLLPRDEDAADDEEALCAAELVERQLLLEGGVDRDDLRSFGARGVSIGYASWSGVAYYPVAPSRALAVDDLVACELLAQAIWCYTSEILRQVEAGQDPVVPVEYGWRFLRGMQSRLIAPRATETGQHNSMRDAVLTTSRLGEQMRAAIDALRQIGD